MSLILFRERRRVAGWNFCYRLSLWALLCLSFPSLGEDSYGVDRTIGTPNLFGQMDARIDFQRIDRRILAREVLEETNRYRIDAGLPPLRDSPALDWIAAEHSRDMAHMGFFSHESPVPGRERLSDRLRLVAVVNPNAGENIITASGLEVAEGRMLFLPEQNGGYFSYEYRGEPILPRSYSGLARHVVRRWMESPGHRANILNPKVRYLGVGHAVHADESFGGMPTFVMTQVFADQAGWSTDSKY